MNQDKKTTVPKAPEQIELPGSKVQMVTVERDATLKGLSDTASETKVGVASVTGNPVVAGGPGSGASDGGISTGSLFSALQDPSSEVKPTGKKKKNRGSRKKVGTGGLEMAGVASPASTKRNHSDGSTPRAIKKGKVDKDDRGYSRALADPNKLAIVAADYPVVRFSEEQGKLVEAALEAALDGVSGNDYVPRFVDCWVSRGALVCHCGGPQDGEWLREAVSKLVPWSEAKLTVLEASKLPKLERMTVFCPGSRDPNLVRERLAKQNGTLNVSGWKLTSSKEVKTKKGETETALYFMVEATEFVALEALEYPWRPFCGLKRAHCVRWSQGMGDGVDQEEMETETGEEEADPSAQAT